MIITRRLNLGEGLLYRATRLEALRESPSAFASRYEDAITRSDQSWADQADASAVGSDRATFVAIDEQPVGLAALYRSESAPDVGELIQMWVAPGMRGGSVATDLLHAIFQWAGAQHFSCVSAEVMRDNFRALRFYEKFGFTACDDRFAELSVILTKPI